MTIKEAAYNEAVEKQEVETKKGKWSLEFAFEANSKTHQVIQRRGARGSYFEKEGESKREKNASNEKDRNYGDNQRGSFQ